MSNIARWWNKIGEVWMWKNNDCSELVKLTYIGIWGPRPWYLDLDSVYI
jgi:hypothetical protein